LQWWQMSILVWGVSGIVGSASVWIGVIVSGSPPLAYEQAADVTWGWLVAGAGLVVLMMIVTLLVFSVNWRARKKT